MSWHRDLVFLWAFVYGSLWLHHGQKKWNNQSKWIFLLNGENWLLEKRFWVCFSKFSIITHYIARNTSGNTCASKAVEYLLKKTDAMIFLMAISSPIAITVFKGYLFFHLYNACASWNVSHDIIVSFSKFVQRSWWPPKPTSTTFFETYFLPFNHRTLQLNKTFFKVSNRKLPVR